ncbi:MAG TPA: hypothetical protein VMN60_08575 [Longimicrobiales bacterium]|nr:hypothetical protein [Longimicrobiales bacterium]
MTQSVQAAESQAVEPGAETHAAHAALIAEQLAALRAHDAALFTASAAGLDDAAAPVRLSDSGISESRCRALAAADARFGFLASLSQSAAVAVAAAAALETSLFGRSESAVVPRIVAPLQAFVRLLDGLVDDAPDLFEQWKAEIAAAVARGLSDADAPPHDPRNAHELLGMIHDVTASWTAAVRDAPGWVEDPSIRDAVCQAVASAMRAEYESAHCVMGGVAPDVAAMRARVRAKSTSTAWVVALVPIIAHGWPPWLDRQRYEHVAMLFGTYVGWVDDVCDIFEDLDSGVWSDALLELWDLAGRPALAGAADAAVELPVLLTEPAHRARLVATGVAHHHAFFDALRETGADPEPMARLIARVL